MEHGLIAFCWGDDNNNAATIRYLKELGLHGVIYDRITDHIPHTEKKSIFLTDHQSEMLQLAVMSPEAEINPDSSIIHMPSEEEEEECYSNETKSLSDSPTLYRKEDYIEPHSLNLEGPFVEVNRTLQS